MWTLCGIMLLMGAALAQAQHPQGTSRCPTPGPLENGRTLVLYGGLRAEFQCNRGYTPMGTNYALCADGKWTWDPPICVASGCPVLDPMEHGFMAVSYSGAVVRFWCLEGYFLKGSQIIICDGRKWNDSQPNCVGKSGGVAWNKVGKSNDFSFRFNHHKKHNKFSTWSKTHEEWLEEADYSCIATTSAVPPPRVPHASPSTKWVVVEGKARLYTVYRCKWGYVPIGEATNLYCKSSEWVGTKPKCFYKGIPQRTTSPLQADGWSNYGPNTHEQRLRSADYSCFKSKEGVTAPDVHSATKIPRHAVLDGMPHLYVEYQCHPGYSLDGPEYLYCQNEKWHGDLPRCVWKGQRYADDANSHTLCEQNNGGCSHQCIMVGNEAKCACSEGLELNSDGQTCGDIDECKTEDHGCQQLCFNVHGSYECLCHEGFSMTPDGSTCEKIEPLKTERETLDDKIPPLVVFHHE